MQEIYIEDTGSGYPLVLVHGYLGSSEMWNLQKEYLSKHFRIITPALPGFGESHNVKSVDNINAMAKSVFQILDKKSVFLQNLKFFFNFKCVYRKNEKTLEHAI